VSTPPGMLGTCKFITSDLTKICHFEITKQNKIFLGRGTAPKRGVGGENAKTPPHTSFPSAYDDHVLPCIPRNSILQHAEFEQIICGTLRIKISGRGTAPEIGVGGENAKPPPHTSFPSALRSPNLELVLRPLIMR